MKNKRVAHIKLNEYVTRFKLRTYRKMAYFKDVVLVTGASGYIASHIISQLLEKGYKVRGTVRSLSNEDKITPLRKLGGSANDNLELKEADLLNPDCWPEVVKGCTYVLHTASPFPMENPINEDDVIKPAVEGTLNVLKACGSDVKRVVLTSSTAAVHMGQKDPPSDKIYTEEDWTNTDQCSVVYEKSKTLAEKAAWDYVKELPSEQRFELAVLNPALVFGPLLTPVLSTSVRIIQRIMIKDMPLLPRFNFCVVDVRDVAAAHITAMTSPEAAGHRHILAGPNLWFSEMAAILEKEFKPMKYDIPTGNAPYPLMWIVARFDKSVKMILPGIGKVYKCDNSRMVNVLGVSPRPVENTLIDTGYSLIESGHVKKTALYKPRHN